MAGIKKNYIVIFILLATKHKELSFLRAICLRAGTCLCSILRNNYSCSGMQKSLDLLKK